MTIIAARTIYLSSQMLYRQTGRFVGQLKSVQERENKRLKDELVKEGELLADQLAGSVGKVMMTYDYDSLEALAKGAEKDSDLGFVTFFRTAGMPVTSKADRAAEALVTKRQVESSGETLGYVEIRHVYDSATVYVEAFCGRITEMIRSAERPRPK